MRINRTQPEDVTCIAITIQSKAKADVIKLPFGHSFIIQLCLAVHCVFDLGFQLTHCRMHLSRSVSLYCSKSQFSEHM